MRRGYRCDGSIISRFICFIWILFLNRKVSANSVSSNKKIVFRKIVFWKMNISFRVLCSYLSGILEFSRKKLKFHRLHPNCKYTVLSHAQEVLLTATSITSLLLLLSWQQFICSLIHVWHWHFCKFCDSSRTKGSPHDVITRVRARVSLASANS